MLNHCLTLTSALKRVTKYLRVQHVKVCRSWISAIARYAIGCVPKIRAIDVWHRCGCRDLIAQEVREYGICVNGYAPGTIQTDLGMCCCGLVFHLVVMSVRSTSFAAVEAEKAAGDKSIQEVIRTCPVCR